MSQGTQTSAQSLTANVTLNVGGHKIALNLSVAREPMPVRNLIPLAQEIAHTIIGLAVKDVTEQGKQVSCRKGCGACCRQLVPIAAVEARQIRDLVENLPEPRRTAIRARFAQARAKLEEAGILHKLKERADWPTEIVRQVGLDYFHLGIPCPFLEDESCSIHPDRPISCREYLVTSPPENCARPSAETVAMIPIPLKTWPALARFDRVTQDKKYLHWVPLILALEPEETESSQLEERPGTDLVKEFFQNLTGKGVPAPIGG